jgi:CDP-6-deoxy-D-xylo-4-hexulose-3-dehydrase
MHIEEIQNTIKGLFNLWCIEKEKKRQLQQKIQYAGPVLGEGEYGGILDAIFSDWWSRGKYTTLAQKKLAELSSRKYGLLLNSGSSANLVMMKAAKELFKWEDGDKIITLSCGFPTTVNPILDCNLVPLFVDIDLATLGLDPDLLEEVLKKETRVKGVFVAHTLGFPNKIFEILNLARQYNVQVFFDCCDAYGTTYGSQPIQTYGKAATFSYYVAHHVTSGEGGGIVTNDTDLQLVMNGFRNWGRYCSSPDCCIRATNREVFCSEERLTKECDLPDDYSVNYQFEWLGYNLKMLDLQAAMLLTQLDRLPEFTKIRQDNYRLLWSFMNGSKFGFKLWEINNTISPFSFPFILPEDVPFQRKHLVHHLARHGIETRLLFGGNLTKHPAYVKVKNKWQLYGESHPNADLIMNRCLMLGVSPIITTEKLARVITVLQEFEKQW